MNDAERPPPFTLIPLDFPPAERVGAKVEYLHYLPHEKLYQIDVCFVGAPPPQAAIDCILRECIALAAAHDGRFNIHADAYLLPDAGADLDRRESLAPYGDEHFLCFDAGLRQIGVRRNGRKHFEPSREITPVHTLGTGDNLDHPDRPSHPVYEGEDMEADLDEATEDMRALVSEWIWYGYSAMESIDRWIEENAAAGDGFDLAWIRNFAVRVLARKRAAEAGWPEETDNDRLDRAFARLNEQGICAVQWAGHDIQEGLQAVRDALDEAEEAGVPEDHHRGFCFFHSQDMDRALDGGGLLLAFDAIDGDTDADTIRIGRAICEALAQEGLKTRWNGSADSRIGLPDFCWQRRTPD